MICEGKETWKLDEDANVSEKSMVGRLPVVPTSDKLTGSDRKCENRRLFERRSEMTSSCSFDVLKIEISTTMSQLLRPRAE